MLGHRDWVVALRGKVLLQSVESSVPTKHVPEELKEFVILEGWGRGGGDKSGSGTQFRAINEQPGERVLNKPNG